MVVEHVVEGVKPDVRVWIFLLLLFLVPFSRQPFNRFLPCKASLLFKPFACMVHVLLTT